MATLLICIKINFLKLRKFCEKKFITCRSFLIFTTQYPNKEPLFMSSKECENLIRDANLDFTR